MIGGRPVVGIEGTHGSGKSAVASALVARLVEKGLGPVLVEDVGRASPFVRDVVAGKADRVGLLGELALFAGRVKAEVEASREAGMVVCDRTVLAGLGYLRADALSEERASPLAAAFEALSLEYARTSYDLLVLLDRSFDWSGDAWSDPLRYPGPGRQHAFKALALDLIAETCVPHLIVTTLADAWDVSGTILEELATRGLLPASRRPD